MTFTPLNIPDKHAIPWRKPNVRGACAGYKPDDEVTPDGLATVLQRLFTEQYDQQRERLFAFERWSEQVSKFKGTAGMDVQNYDFARCHVYALMPGQFPADGNWHEVTGWQRWTGADAAWEIYEGDTYPVIEGPDFTLEDYGVVINKPGLYAVQGDMAMDVIGAVPDTYDCGVGFTFSTYYQTQVPVFGGRVSLTYVSWFDAGTLINLHGYMRGTGAWSSGGGGVPSANLTIQRLHYSTVYDGSLGEIDTVQGDTITIPHYGVWAVMAFCHSTPDADRFELYHDVSFATAGSPDLVLNRECRATSRTLITWAGYCNQNDTFRMQAFLDQTSLSSDVDIFAVHIPGMYPGPYRPAYARYYAGPGRVRQAIDLDTAGYPQSPSWWTLDSSNYGYNNATTNNNNAGIQLNNQALLLTTSRVTFRSIDPTPDNFTWARHDFQTIVNTGNVGHHSIPDAQRPAIRNDHSWSSQTNTYIGWVPVASRTYVYAWWNEYQQSATASGTWQIDSADCYVAAIAAQSRYDEGQKLVTTNLHVPYKFAGSTLQPPSIGPVVQANAGDENVTYAELERILTRVFDEQAEFNRQNWLEMERWSDRLKVQ